MQTYRELRVLTARPTPDDEAAAPHRLYGVRPAADPGDAAWWRDAALAEMQQCSLPILCGGTGLYLASLVQGIADIPPPGETARQEARALLGEIGPAALHARLLAEDPETALRLRPTDSQRLARAWEVWRGTGQGLAAWQARPGVPAPWRFAAVVLDPSRPELRAAIATRWTAMLKAGALDEVAALLAQGLDPALPAMRAHGVPELAAVLAGQRTLIEAGTAAVAATGRYTKRQATWMRHHVLADPGFTHTIYARYAGRTQFQESILPFVRSFLIGAG
jgi:tRNA dimethylallyltransferase